MHFKKRKLRKRTHTLHKESGLLKFARLDILFRVWPAGVRQIWLAGDFELKPARTKTQEMQKGHTVQRPKSRTQCNFLFSCLFVYFNTEAFEDQYLYKSLTHSRK